MKRQAIPLGRILGIPIGLDYSWFLVFAFLTWMLAVSYFPQEFHDWPPLLYWVMGVVTTIMLFVSVLLHELGHSVVALRFKVPVRSITLFTFGGVAQIGTEPPSPRAEFLIAIAGPIVSLALAVLFTIVQPVAGIETIWGLARYLAYINFALVLFDLIPGSGAGRQVLRSKLRSTAAPVDKPPARSIPESSGPANTSRLESRRSFRLTSGRETTSA